MYIRQTKNDSKDSFIIAQVMRFGQCSETNLSDENVVAMRQPARFRMALLDNCGDCKRHKYKLRNWTSRFTSCSNTSIGSLPPFRSLAIRLVLSSSAKLAIFTALMHRTSWSLLPGWMLKSLSLGISPEQNNISPNEATLSTAGYLVRRQQGDILRPQPVRILPVPQSQRKTSLDRRWCDLS